MSASSDSKGHCVAEIVNTFSLALSRGPLCNTTLLPATASDTLINRGRADSDIWRTKNECIRFTLSSPAESNRRARGGGPLHLRISRL